MRVRAAGVGLILAVSLAGCGDAEPVDPCQVNPTYQDVFGQWREADGEPLDDDPCDADDLEDDDGWEIRKPARKKTTTTRRR